MLIPVSSLVAFFTWSIHIRYSQHDSAFISMLWNRSFLWILLRIKSTYALASATLLRKRKTYISNKWYQLLRKCAYFYLTSSTLPSLLGAYNDFAEACKHNGRTKTLEFCNKLGKKVISILKPNKMGAPQIHPDNKSTIPAYTVSSSFSEPSCKELSQTEVLLVRTTT